MFNLITPKKRIEFKSELDEMFARLESEYGPDFRDRFDHDQAQYLVYSHKKYGVIGGARLIPHEHQGLSSDFLKRLQFEPKIRIWEISRIFFHVPADPDTMSDVKFEVLLRDFYLNMYDSLKTISIAQKIRAFITVLPEEEHQNAIHFGLWPFDKQGKLASPYKDGKPHVFGYMTMNDLTYQDFINRRMHFESTATIC